MKKLYYKIINMIDKFIINFIIISVIILFLLIPIKFIFVTIFGPSPFFSEYEWKYMINQIEQKFGNGREFIVLSQIEEPITENSSVCINDYETGCKEVVGEIATIIGYFEEKSNGFRIKFNKYTKEGFNHNMDIELYSYDYFDTTSYVPPTEKDFFLYRLGRFIFVIGIILVMLGIMTFVPNKKFIESGIKTKNEETVEEKVKKIKFIFKISLIVGIIFLMLSIYLLDLYFPNT